jgi:hypothetical protein
VTNWQEIEKDAPDFAARVRARFAMGTNKTIATLRKDGSPRISASELQFDDGEVTPRDDGRLDEAARRAPRPSYRVHNPTIEPPGDDADGWSGDAKLAGTAAQVDPPADNPHQGAGFFKLNITEVVLTYVGTPADHLVIESWHPGPGHQRRTRT